MAVIFSRAPLRISLGGGGTDLPSYYREHGGFLVSGAIDKYVYMLTHTVFQRRYRLKYAEFEEVDDPHEIRHPILREVLIRHWRGEPLEIASVADVPAGTGMGSSGAYTVCLLKALALARHTTLPPRELAEAACEIEIDVLKEPVGKQDQYVAAHGGVCAYTFNPDDTVTVEPLELDPETLRRMSSNFLLFYTGEARSASALLADQNRRTHQQDNSMLENLHRTKEMGLESRVLLEAGDLERFAELMDEHWQNKRERSPGMANENIDRLYTLARRSPAWSAASWSAPAAAASCSCMRRGRTTRARRCAPRACRSCASSSTSRARSARSAGGEGRDRRLRPDRPQAGGGAGRGRAGGVLRPRATTLEPAVDSVEAVLDAADAVIVATPHDTLAELDDRGAGGGQARAGREAGRDRDGAGPCDRSRGGAGRHVRPRRLQPPLPSRDRARGRGGAVGRARRDPARARPLRPRRPARLRPRVARRPRALGRRRADRPGHAPARPQPLAARPAAAALGAAADGVLGRAGRGQRGADPRRARRPARGRCSTSPGPSGRTSSASRSTAARRSCRSTVSRAPTARSGSRAT